MVLIGREKALSPHLCTMESTCNAAYPSIDLGSASLQLTYGTLVSYPIDMFMLPALTEERIVAK